MTPRTLTLGSPDSDVPFRARCRALDLLTPAKSSTRTVAVMVRRKLRPDIVLLLPSPMAHAATARSAGIALTAPLLCI
jgi:hypothetical protein